MASHSNEVKRSPRYKESNVGANASRGCPEMRMGMRIPGQFSRVYLTAHERIKKANRRFSIFTCGIGRRRRRFHNTNIRKPLYTCASEETAYQGEKFF